MTSNHVKLVFIDGKSKQISYQTKPISSGADGTIYASDDNKLALKIYHDPNKDNQRQDKLWQMLANAPKSDGFCWPVAVLCDDQGIFIGYAMPLLDLSHYQTLEMLLNKRLRNALDITESYQFRVKVALNLAKTVAELHQLGHHIIDMKPVNISFNQLTGDIVILDCDGFSIKGKGKQFKGHQYTAGYIAPEAFKAHLSPDKLGVEQDLFALATILFQLLNNGLHPFQGVPKNGLQLPTDNQAKITAGLYAYARKAHRKIKPSPWSIHRDFPTVFMTAFTKSLTTKYRVNAATWQKILREQKRKLKACDKNENHFHWRRQCPHCQLALKHKNVKPRRIIKRALIGKKFIKKVPVQKVTPVHQPASVQKTAPPQQTQFVKTKNTSKNNAPIPRIFFVIFIIIIIISVRHRLSLNVEDGSSKVEDEKTESHSTQVEQSLSPPTKIAQISGAKSISGSRAFRSKKQQFDRDSVMLAAVPFHQLSRFKSETDYPLLKHSPLSSSFITTSPIMSLNKIDFGIKQKEVAHLDTPSTRGYRLDDWQYDDNNERAYVYYCRFGPNICTHVTQIGTGKRVNFKFNDFADQVNEKESSLGLGNVRKLGTSKNSYRPWRFSLTKNNKKLVMASNSEIVIYDVNSPNKALLKQALPKQWNDLIITRLLSLDNGQRLIMSLGKSQKYGINYQGFVVELSLVDGAYQVTTDFSTLVNANPMSGVDVATNLAGDILAIGEYIEPELNNTKYQMLSTPIEVELAYPAISFWQKTEQGWQSINSPQGEEIKIPSNTSNYKLYDEKIIVGLPDDISNSSSPMIFQKGPKLLTDPSLNRGFMFNQSGDKLLTGLNGVQYENSTYASASLYELNKATGSLLHKAVLKKEYESDIDINKKSQIYLSASLSNDGKQASFGWFQYFSNGTKTLHYQRYQMDIFYLYASF